jgi:GNAT superfamily N-acetyltransferase
VEGGELLLREASRADISHLTEFNAALAFETEDKRLDVARLRAGVTALFDRPGLGRSFIAERSGTPVGCMMLTTEWSDWRNGNFWWVQSVFVRPEARGLGVFRALYGHVLARARAEADVCGLRLYVERANVAAQSVYERVGMSRSSYQMFEVDFVLGRNPLPQHA